MSIEQKKNKYEGMFLLNNSKINTDGTTAVTRVNEVLQKHGASVVRTEVWDERRLAYPVADQKRGTYVLSHFESFGTNISAITREVQLSEDVLRVLTLHHDEFPEFKTAAELEGARRRDGDGRRRTDDGDGEYEGRRRRPDDGDGEYEGRRRRPEMDEDSGSDSDGDDSSGS